MSECVYHPIYRSCRNCGADMERNQVRKCLKDLYRKPEPISERITALREARELIKNHAMSTWKGGLTERSDGITEVLVDFDLKFPEAKE